MWDAIGTIETIVGLSLGISLALAVVDSWDSIAVGMWDAIGTIETIIGLSLGISITLAKSKRDAVKAIGGGDSLASQLVLLDGCALVEASLFLGSSVLRGDGTIGVVHQTGVLEGDLGNNTNSNIWNNGGTQQASGVQLGVSSGAGASGGSKSHD